MTELSLWKYWGNIKISGKDASLDDVYKLSDNIKRVIKDGGFCVARLKLNNFRCFRKLSVSFDRKLTVFHGINGRGKSSILEIVAKSLSWIIAGMEASTKRGMQLSEDDIRLETKRNLSDDITDALISISFDGEYINSMLRKSRDGLPKSVISDVRDFQSLGELFRNISARTISPRPLLLYFSTDRSAQYRGIPSDKVYKSTLKTLETNQFGVIAFDRAIKESKDPGQFIGWFTFYAKREMLNQNLEIQKDAKEKISIVKQAICNFWHGCSDVWLDASTGIDCVYVRIDDIDLKINQMSDGQRMVFFLFGEIAWRLIELNRSKEAMEGGGVVLIDEIELHLHPQWQGVVIESLQKTFPNIQFIITTHSPQVLSWVPGKCVRELPEVIRDVEELQNSNIQTRSLSSNDILERVMKTNAAPKQFEEVRLLDECERNILNGDFDNAKKLISELEKYFGVDDYKIEVLKTMYSVMINRKQENK